MADREAFTLRKLLAKLPPDELAKFMDAPLQVYIRDQFGNKEFVDIADDWPNRIAPDLAHENPGRFALIANADFGIRRPKAA